MYDYLIVGSGLFGSVFARSAKDDGKKVLIIEKSVIFGGRLSEYKYYDMHQVIGSALNSYKK